MSALPAETVHEREVLLAALLETPACAPASDAHLQTDCMHFLLHSCTPRQESAEHLTVSRACLAYGGLPKCFEHVADSLLAQTACLRQ